MYAFSKSSTTSPVSILAGPSAAHPRMTAFSRPSSRWEAKLAQASALAQSVRQSNTTQAARQSLCYDIDATTIKCGIGPAPPPSDSSATFAPE